LTVVSRSDLRDPHDYLRWKSSYRATEEDLSAVFAEYGTVKRIVLPTDRETGRMRGFAFVEMEEDAQEDAAITQLMPNGWGVTQS